MKVLIVVTHLLGTGHLSRALTLGRAFAAAGDDVVVLSGGMPASQLDYTDLQLVQLPPVTSDGVNFSRLLNASGDEIDGPYRAERFRVALDTLADFAPDVVITELYPFGRRSLSEEFLTILDAASNMHPRPRVLCSIRDILAPPSKPSKAEKAEAVLVQYYDSVLVHSDPNITTLDASWPVTPTLGAMVKYTGYVAPPAAEPLGDRLGVGEVLVSAGGGSVGQALFECAIEAARLSDLPWRLLVGGKDRDSRISALKVRAGSHNTTIEGVRPEFRSMLHSAACSVSMCGYNTALDILQTGVPSVLVPFDDGGEVEQTLRAKSLAHQQAMEVLCSADLTPERMAGLVSKAISEGRRHEKNLLMNGAQTAVELTHEIVRAAV